MAKKQNITVHSCNVTDAGMELRFKAEFTTSLFKGDTPIPHIMNADLSFTDAEWKKILIKGIVIDEQKWERALNSHAKIRERLGKTLTKADIYPGVRVSHVNREMTDDELMAEIAKRGLARRIADELEDQIEEQDEE
jgi:hypothetical protein